MKECDKKEIFKEGGVLKDKYFLTVVSELLLRDKIDKIECECALKTDKNKAMANYIDEGIISNPNYELCHKALDCFNGRVFHFAKTFVFDTLEELEKAKNINFSWSFYEKIYCEECSNLSSLCIGSAIIHYQLDIEPSKDKRHYVFRTKDYLIKDEFFFSKYKSKCFKDYKVAIMEGDEVLLENEGFYTLPFKTNFYVNALTNYMHKDLSIPLPKEEKVYMDCMIDNFDTMKIFEVADSSCDDLSSIPCILESYVYSGKAKVRGQTRVSVSSIVNSNW